MRGDCARENRVWVKSSRIIGWRQGDRKEKQRGASGQCVPTRSVGTRSSRTLEQGGEGGGDVVAFHLPDQLVDAAVERAWAGAGHVDEMAVVIVDLGAAFGQVAAYRMP